MDDRYYKSAERREDVRAQGEGSLRHSVEGDSMQDQAYGAVAQGDYGHVVRFSPQAAAGHQDDLLTEAFSSQPLKKQ